MIAELSPEQRVVAEHVLRGGLPAVRQAVEEQNAKARAVAGPEIKADALMAIAEDLVLPLRAAEWRDRAEAAAASVDEISLRDLRSVVTGADVARDDEGRSLAVKLREALDRRSAAEQQAWTDEITTSLEAGRVVRALRLSGRPPEPGFRFPADLANRLSEAAGEALTADTTADRWAAVLEAIVASPVRRTIKPRGVPAELSPELTKAIRLAAPRVPALAGLVPDDKTAPTRPPRPRGPRPVPGAPGERPGDRGAPTARTGPPRPHGPPRPPRPAPPAATPETAAPPAEAETTAPPIAEAETTAPPAETEAAGPPDTEAAAPPAETEASGPPETEASGPPDTEAAGPAVGETAAPPETVVAAEVREPATTPPVPEAEATDPVPEDEAVPDTERV